MALQTAVLHVIFVCLNSCTCKYSFKLVLGLVQGFQFLKHYKYWVTFETCLRYSAVVQSQDDLAARQGIQGQDSRQLLSAAYLSALDADYHLPGTIVLVA